MAAVQSGSAGSPILIEEGGSRLLYRLGLYGDVPAVLFRPKRGETSDSEDRWLLIVGDNEEMLDSLRCGSADGKCIGV